jgi:hypothetical protein
MARFVCYRGALTRTEAPARCTGMRRYHDLQDMPLQYRARVLPRAAGKSCDPIGRGYAVDRMPRGGINKTERVGHRPHHHYTTSAFNALYMV